MSEAKAQPGQAGTVDGQQLAALLEIDLRHVRDFGERGVMKRIGRNRYDFVASIRGYTKHLRELAADHKSGSGLDNQSENALFTRERRRKLQLEGDTAAGKLIRVDLVEQVMVDHIKGVRGMILGIVNEAQTELPELTAYELDILRKICEGVLRDNAFRVIEGTKMHPEVQEHIDRAQGRAPI